MFAAIPFLSLPAYDIPVPGIGVLPLDPWALLVCTGFVVGLEIARARAIRLGLDVRDIVDGAVFIVLMGFLWGHIITVVAYYPERLKTDGIWSLLRVWEGFSSFGGFLGAVIGWALFYGVIRRRPALRMADVIVYGFPFGWFFGRLGCGVVHDHIGRLTTSPIGMDFDHGIPMFHGTGDPYSAASGIRFELGLTEAAYMVGVAALWLYLGRKDRVPGFYLGLFAVVYAPVRFCMDFLRNNDLGHQDVRYYGLTPAQYGSIIMLTLGLAVLATRNWKGFKPWAMDGKPDQDARANGDAPS